VLGEYAMTSDNIPLLNPTCQGGRACTGRVQLVILVVW